MGPVMFGEVHQLISDIFFLYLIELVFLFSGLTNNG